MIRECQIRDFRSAQLRQGRGVRIRQPRTRTRNALLPRTLVVRTRSRTSAFAVKGDTVASVGDLTTSPRKALWSGDASPDRQITTRKRGKINRRHAATVTEPPAADSWRHAHRDGSLGG